MLGIYSPSPHLSLAEGYPSDLAFVSQDGAISPWDSKSQGMGYSIHGFSLPGICEFIIMTPTFPYPPLTHCFLP